MAKSDVAKLRKCIKACNGDADCRKACEAKFKKNGGTVEGGKVFIDSGGDVIFVTKGGKVFGGKVF